MLAPAFSLVSNYSLLFPSPSLPKTICHNQMDSLPCSFYLVEGRQPHLLPPSREAAQIIPCSLFWIGMHLPRRLQVTCSWQAASLVLEHEVESARVCFAECSSQQAAACRSGRCPYTLTLSKCSMMPS